MFQEVQKKQDKSSLTIQEAELENACGKWIIRILEHRYQIFYNKNQ